MLTERVLLQAVWHAQELTHGPKPSQDPDHWEMLKDALLRVNLMSHYKCDDGRSGLI